eukprot:gene17566-9197_t
MAEETEFDANSSSQDDDENYVEKPMPKQLTTLFGDFIVTGASKAAGVVGTGASYIVPVPNVWPDMDNIDNLVNVLTITGYAFTAFSVVGTTYFLTRTAREAWQWRTWMRYRKNVTRKLNERHKQ